MSLAGFQAHVEVVRQQNPILPVIQERLAIGPGTMAICPFHEETTPSLHVHAERGYFYCFGCHTGGDVFRFVQLYENLDFTGALHLLEARAHIRPYHAAPLEEAQVFQERAVEEVTEVFAGVYHRALKDVAGAEARTYLTETRKIPSDCVEAYRLGWGAPGITESVEALSPGMADAAITAGLAYRVPMAMPGVFPYRDRLRRRIIFPVQRDGMAVFLSGRATDPGQVPKYLHQGGREAPLYLGENLHRDQVFVTEGPMDALSLAVWGFPAVALQGGMRASAAWALRATTMLYGVFDADAAGRKSAMALATTFANAERTQVKLVVLPEGEDPNDFYRTHPKSAFEDLVAQAMDPITFATTMVPRTLPRTKLAVALAPVFQYLAVLTPYQAEACLMSVLSTLYEFSRAEMGAARQTITQYREGLHLQCPVCQTVLTKGR